MENKLNKIEKLMKDYAAADHNNHEEWVEQSKKVLKDIGWILWKQ